MEFIDLTIFINVFENAVNLFIVIFRIQFLFPRFVLAFFMGSVLDQI
jgi:hypothetical protein